MSERTGETSSGTKRARSTKKLPKGNGRADVQEHPDPLDDLLARVTVNVENAYSPETVKLLATVKQNNVGSYLKLCADLKQANRLFVKGELDTLIEKVTASSISLDNSPASAAEVMLKLAEPVPLFTSQDKGSFADVVVDDHRFTCHVREGDFKDWLTNQYFEATGRAPAREALQAAIDTLAAKARRGPKVTVHARIGHADGKVYIDRGTEDYSLIEVDAQGWRIVDDAPIRFIRPADGIGELPVPLPGGSIEQLRPFVHFRSDVEFTLAVGWILGCYQPHGAYAGALLLGPHGSMKTSSMKRMCALVDPLTDEPWSPPREERDAIITAQRTHVQPIDNVIHISADQAGVYCRMSTGGKLRSRKYFTDNEERVQHAKRPVILTSTRAVVTQEDQVDRYLFLAMGEAEIGSKRKREEVLDEEFAAAWPTLLGAVLDAVSDGLRRKADPSPPALPRMADFADWVSRCERALGWHPGTFLTAYRQNIHDSARLTAELDLVASTVVSFMERRATWTDTPTILLKELRLIAGDRAAMTRDWPKSPNWLSHRLEELSTLLHRNGIAVLFDRSAKARTITLTTSAEPEAAAEPELDFEPKPARRRTRTSV